MVRYLSAYFSYACWELLLRTLTLQFALVGQHILQGSEKQPLDSWKCFYKQLWELIEVNTEKMCLGHPQWHSSISHKYANRRTVEWKECPNNKGSSHSCRWFWYYLPVTDLCAFAINSLHSLRREKGKNYKCVGVPGWAYVKCMQLCVSKWETERLENCDF